MTEENSRDLLHKWLKNLSNTEMVYTALIKRYKLTKHAFYVLDALYSHLEGEEPAMLAEKIGVSRQMMTLVLNELMARGFILRREHSEDHRRKVIRLSASGKRFAMKICGDLENFDIAALSVFSYEELIRMVEYSTRFYEKIKHQMDVFDA